MLLDWTCALGPPLLTKFDRFIVKSHCPRSIDQYTALVKLTFLSFCILLKGWDWARRMGFLSLKHYHSNSSLEKGVPSAVAFSHCAGSGEGLFLLEFEPKKSKYFMHTKTTPCLWTYFASSCCCCLKKLRFFWCSMGVFHSSGKPGRSNSEG